MEGRMIAEETFDEIPAVLEAVRRGEIVVVADDADRENEADLIMAGPLATAKHLGFMIRHTSGIVCASIPDALARRLELGPMSSDNQSPFATAFTVSVDLRKGLSTGISPEERANTIRALADESITPSDFVRPGHVFPLVARTGGVLRRSGHTEAADSLKREGTRIMPLAASQSHRASFDPCMARSYRSRLVRSASSARLSSVTSE